MPQKKIIWFAIVLASFIYAFIIYYLSRNWPQPGPFEESLRNQIVLILYFVAIATFVMARNSYPFEKMSVEDSSNPDGNVLDGSNANGSSARPRITPDGKRVSTGGGDLSLRVGGALNPLRTSSSDGVNDISAPYSDLNGVLTNLRGAINVDARSIGRVDPLYRAVDRSDSRGLDPLRPTLAAPSGGPAIVAGDATAAEAEQHGVRLIRQAEHEIRNVGGERAGAADALGAKTDAGP